MFENGKSGFLGEHSCMDGTPTLRMTEFAIGALQHGKIDLGAPRTPATGSALDAPTELTFVLDAAAHAHIAQAEADFDALVGAHDMAVLHYEGYGKEFIKKFKTSPDAWAQLVKQLAFHKMFGRPGVCYESAQTRKYQLGRTEVIRAASNESKAWAEAMLNPDTPVRPIEKKYPYIRLGLIDLRFPCARAFSVRPLRATSNTPPGLRTDRVSTVICSA